MGEFSDKLLKRLAGTADVNDDYTMETATPDYGFTAEDYEDFRRFKNAIFKLILLRGYNAIKLRDEKLAKGEESAPVIVNLELRLDTNTVHPPQNTFEERLKAALNEINGKGQEGSVGIRRIPNISPSILDDVDGGIDLTTLVELLNWGVYPLACEVN